ncbi:MAG: glycosyltransferase family 2 protein [Patescibacteria group bacterium]|nr:glycosyltransferase family 2 protein [Patescibacteria group bacterium]
MSAPGCSIIVSTYNRMGSLRQCLPSLLQQTYAPLEIIVVDDGSTDGTAAYLREVTDARLRVVHHERNRGLSAGRNSGIAAARYPIVAFTDDDCVAAPDWVSRLAEPFSDARVGLVIGQAFYEARNVRRYFPERIVQNNSARWPKGCNIAYRREVFTRIGNFSDAYYRYQNEDTEMAIRAVAAGFQFRRVPDAVVFHQPAQWTVAALLASAHNAAVWPLLKRTYPHHYQTFGSPVRWGMVHPFDYLMLLFSPILVPLLFVRYRWHGGRDTKIFFAKWPVFFLLRRFHIIRSALRDRTYAL